MARPELGLIPPPKAAPAIRLHFKVDPRYLAIHTLLNPPVLAPAGVLAGFWDRAWAKDHEAYDFLRSYDAPVGSLANKGPIGQRAEQLVATMMKDAAFLTILADAQHAADKVKGEWEADLPVSMPIMQNLTGLKLDRDLDVLVTHPAQTNGFSWGEDTILWTYREDFPHYNTVYLWHEILHKFVKPSQPTDNVANPAHTVIELLADNELRTRLNGGKYPPWEGHPANNPLRDRLLPTWRDYLASPHKNVLDYLKQADAALNATR